MDFAALFVIFQIAAGYILCFYLIYFGINLMISKQQADSYMSASSTVTTEYKGAGLVGACITVVGCIGVYSVYQLGKGG